MLEYLVIPRGEMGSSDIENMLNRHAIEGWSLAETVTSMGTTTMFVLSRRRRMLIRDTSKSED